MQLAHQCIDQHGGLRIGSKCLQQHYEAHLEARRSESAHLGPSREQQGDERPEGLKIGIQFCMGPSRRSMETHPRTNMAFS